MQNKTRPFLVILFYAVLQPGRSGWESLVFPMQPVKWKTVRMPLKQSNTAPAEPKKERRDAPPQSCRSFLELRTEI
jgi:hypothetical protein